MSKFIEDVLEIENKRSEKGPWVVIKVKDKEGEIRQKNVFGDAANKFQATGRYEVTYEKEGKYWNVKDAVFVGNDRSKVTETVTSVGRFSQDPRGMVLSSAVNGVKDITVALIAAGQLNTITDEDGREILSTRRVIGFAADLFETFLFKINVEFGLIVNESAITNSVINGAEKAVTESVG